MDTSAGSVVGGREGGKGTTEGGQDLQAHGPQQSATLPPYLRADFLLHPLESPLPWFSPPANSDSPNPPYPQVDPDHYRGNDALWLGLCKARRALGLVDAAVEACGAVLVLDPGHREAKLLLVEMLMDAERFEEANAKAREFLQQHRDDGAFHQVGVGEGRDGAHNGRGRQVKGVQGVTVKPRMLELVGCHRL